MPRWSMNGRRRRQISLTVIVRDLVVAGAAFLLAAFCYLRTLGELGGTFV